jgi:hypothetical protein
MTKNDDKKIWESRWSLFSREENAEDHGATGCPEIEKLIASAHEEEAEGREEISVDDEPQGFEDIEAHTPL